MNFSRLNPYIKNFSIYERVNKTEPCISYDCKIIYLISGELSVTTLDGGKAKKIRLCPGNLIFIPAGEEYSLKSRYMRAAIVAFDLFDSAPSPMLPPAAKDSFDRSLISEGEDTAPFDRVIFLEDMEAERDNFINMSNIFTSAEGFFREQVSAMIKLLLLKIANLTDECALPASMVENLDGYIRENVGDEISNTELGAIFGYHPFYISRMLKSKKGITLHQYVISYRMKLAIKLLECSDKSIAEIAEETGFTDASYFTKTFKAQMGITPKEYRGRFKEEFI